MATDYATMHERNGYSSSQVRESIVPTDIETRDDFISDRTSL